MRLLKVKAGPPYKERESNYFTKTPQVLREICLKCPYPAPRCGKWTCAYYKEKAKLLKGKVKS